MSQITLTTQTNLIQALESINISEEGVKDCLHNLKINKASGPDLISPRLLKEGAIVLARPCLL